MASRETSDGIIFCKTCGRVYSEPQLAPGSRARCERCGSVLAKRTTASLHYTGAFTLAALLLYIPANIFPVLSMHMYGATTESTVWGGCVKFYQGGDYFVAFIVFMASICIPLLKLLALFFIVGSSAMGLSSWKLARTKAFKLIELLGRWAMLDVFILATLVSLVKLRGLATIEAGPGAAAFAMVVVLTTLASQSFDPILIWGET